MQSGESGEQKRASHNRTDTGVSAAAQPFAGEMEEGPVPEVGSLGGSPGLLVPGGKGTATGCSQLLQTCISQNSNQNQVGLMKALTK